MKENTGNRSGQTPEGAGDPNAPGQVPGFCLCLSGAGCEPPSNSSCILT